MGVREQIQGVAFLQESPPPQAPTQPLRGKLNQILPTSGFDDFVVQGFLHFSHAPRGRSTLLLGTSFRLLLFGNDSECGIDLRGCDTLSIREFLRYSRTETVPDHSTLSTPLAQRSDLRKRQRDLRVGTPRVAGRVADGLCCHDHLGCSRGVEYAVEQGLGAFGGCRRTQDQDERWRASQNPLGRVCVRSGRQSCDCAGIAGRRTGRHGTHRPNADGGGIRAEALGCHGGRIRSTRQALEIAGSEPLEGGGGRRRASGRETTRSRPNGENSGVGPTEHDNQYDKERDNEHSGRGGLRTRS